jgi:PAS domain S-box-containing protein
MDQNHSSSCESPADTDCELERRVRARTAQLESANGRLRQELLEREKADDALRTSQSFLSSIINHSPYPMWISDEQGTLVKLNRACKELLQISDQDVVGKYNILNDNIVAEQGVLPLVRSVFEDGATVRFEIRYDSSKLKHVELRRYAFVILDVTVFPIRDAKGEIANAVIQHIDITARRESEEALQRANAELERRVSERTAELSAANAALSVEICEREKAEDELFKLNGELEQRVSKRTALLESALMQMESFSYSISHDLRAPLRVVDGYLQLLEEDFGAQFPREAKPFLDKVSSNVKRMGHLIDDLLRFSRVSRQPLVKEMVDIRRLVLEVYDDLGLERGGRLVDLAVGELVPCQADPALLRQLLANLLSNSLKYTRHKEVARIEVGSGVKGGEVTYFVRDNGGGFDMRYADKLFKVFERLHGEHEFEGDGVGLAIVQNIVQRHGGSVWGRGTPGAGAEFSFVLG